jgi:DNA-directed RNA polymerase subunit RPC12/RpoP
MEDLRLFMEAWRRIEACERCGSRAIRIRRLLLDFPRAQGPLYPLWEIRRGDQTAEDELRRGKQLLAYTEGFLKVTVECPQCGYLEREFTGLDGPFPSTLPWPHLASPIVL